MSESSVFLLDTNVLIVAARHYYAFDIAPVFWDALVHHAGNGRLKSIDRVRDEIDRGDDELVEWIHGAVHDSFLPTDDALVLEKYGQIMFWAQGQQQYSESAKREFAQLELADPWLVAYAAAHHCVLVTLEERNQTIKRKIPLPNVCNAFHVDYLNTFEMLRSLQIRLG